MGLFSTSSGGSSDKAFTSPFINIMLHSGKHTCLLTSVQYCSSTSGINVIKLQHLTNEEFRFYNTVFMQTHKIYLRNKERDQAQENAVNSGFVWGFFSAPQLKFHMKIVFLTCCCRIFLMMEGV